MYKNAAGEIGFEVSVGGGLGRTPFIAKVIRDFLPKEHLLSYIEAILRIYNAYGRRDNIYKARVKILVHDLGAERFGAEVEEEWAKIKDSYLWLDPAVVADIRSRFIYPEYEKVSDNPQALRAALSQDANFALWHKNSVSKHKAPGYSIVTLSLKPTGKPPGDATSGQMDTIADLADQYSHGEIRVGHEQNLALPHVRQEDLPELWRKLDAIGVATPNVNLVTDIIACPGLDYCSLANARSIPIAMELTRRFQSLDKAHSIGRLHVNISGCINACGHHHVGHIGILGVEKNGKEFYQVTLGGKADEDATLGLLLGPAVPFDQIAGVVEQVVNRYLGLRQDESELFIDTVRRLGVAPFKDALHAVH
jgi:sulfite reductase (NADPH) hemoprotein beta-component